MGYKPKVLPSLINQKVPSAHSDFLSPEASPFLLLPVAGCIDRIRLQRCAKKSVFGEQNGCGYCLYKEKKSLEFTLQLGNIIIQIFIKMGMWDFNMRVDFHL